MQWSCAGVHSHACTVMSHTHAYTYTYTYTPVMLAMRDVELHVAVEAEVAL